jgi:hypothetical protein
MKILAIAKVSPQTTLENMQPHLEAEVKHAWTLYKNGTVREMYDRQDRRGVVFVLECGSLDEARKDLDRLPLVREKLIDFEMVILEPFFYFEMMFKN